MSGLMVGDLRWEVRSRGEGAALLLIHGFTGRGSSWGTHARAFANAFRVTVVDLPGHGRSGIPHDAARVSVERTADDLATILRKQGGAPAHVLGYSLGARIALRLAIAHPDAVHRLVLESPSAGLATEAQRRARRRADEDRARGIERAGLAAFVDEWEREPVFASLVNLPPALAALLRQERLRNRPAGLAVSLRGAGQGSMDPLIERVTEVRAPTLVIAGALDPTGRARAQVVADGIPGARLEVIAGAGHTPHLEIPRTFRRLALAFLKEDYAA